MADPTDQDKLSEDWGLDDTIVPVDIDTPEEQSEEEKAAEATAEWAAMLEDRKSVV